MDGSYHSLKGESEAIIKEKGSKFIGFSRAVRSHDEAETFLTELKARHPKARHHCFAWRMGHPEVEERANDDGEPSGTAGRPILGQLVKQDLTDAMIVVVRYFGGTLLGTSGLIQAYKECAEAVLQESRVIRIIQKETWNIDIDFGIVHILEEWAPKFGYTILERAHKEAQMRYLIEIPITESTNARRELIAKLLEVYSAEVDMERSNFEKFTIQKL